MNPPHSAWVTVVLCVAATLHLSSSVQCDRGVVWLEEGEDLIITPNAPRLSARQPKESEWKASCVGTFTTDCVDDNGNARAESAISLQDAETGRDVGEPSLFEYDSTMPTEIHEPNRVVKLQYREATARLEKHYKCTLKCNDGIAGSGAGRISSLGDPCPSCALDSNSRSCLDEMVLNDCSDLATTRLAASCVDRLYTALTLSYSD